MKLEVMLFGPVREAAGIDRAVVEARAGSTVQEIALGFLNERGVAVATLPPIRFAVNEVVVADAYVPADGDRVVVLTPFAGG